MTPQQQADRLNAFIANFDTLVADSFEGAILNLKTDINSRIFGEHEDIYGNKLGQYSTKPTLIGAKSFVAKPSVASTFFNSLKKEEPSKWRTVKVGKTKSKNAHLYLLDGGYKELRQLQDRQTAEIDLQYTFELAKSGLTTNINGNVYQVKFSNLLAQKKGRGFEKRKGKKVFYASTKEQKNAYAFVARKVIKSLKEAFNNV